MIKILSAKQIREIDKCTIENQRISSIDLMERASLAIYDILKQKLNHQNTIYVFAGNGNNGGDALALARMLLLAHFHLQVFIVNPDKKLSPDCEANRERLSHLIPIQIIREDKDIPNIPDDNVIIDGLFGSGLNRPVEGIYKNVIKSINTSLSTTYSIDIPSGLFVDNNSLNNPDTIIKADEVFTFQSPKLSLILPDSGSFSKRMTIVDIGLCQKCINEHSSDFYYLEDDDIRSKIKIRETFSHKGTFGHALLIAGSYGKMGAAIMAAKSCLRTGLGLLTVHTAHSGINILQISVPEAMVIPCEKEKYTRTLPPDIDKYSVIGVGPGIGTEEGTKDLIYQLFEHYRNPLVLDADAINIIANNEYLKSRIPPQSILTPHVKEFERLVGKNFANSQERLLAARNFSERYDVYIVLKGAYTAITTPKKQVYFNSTGNPGMATAGSGDVLTGIITSLTAQKYSPKEAAIIGTFLHGYAGDLSAIKNSQYSMLASDIIENIGEAYKRLLSSKKEDLVQY